MSTQPFAIQKSESGPEETTDVPMLQYASSPPAAYHVTSRWIIVLGFLAVATIGCLAGAIWLPGLLPWVPKVDTESQTQVLQEHQVLLTSIEEGLGEQAGMLQTLQTSTETASERWEQEQAGQIGELKQQISVQFSQIQREWVALQETLSTDLESRDHQLGWAYYQLAMSYMDQQRHGEALTEFKKAVGLAPETSLFWNQLGYCHLAMGSAVSAIQAFREYVRLSPSDANAYDSLAEGYLQAGELKSAEEAYCRTIELSPHQGSAYYGLGKVYEKMGLPRLAVAQYERMVRQFSGSSVQWTNSARERLQVLNSSSELTSPVDSTSPTAISSD